jgi:hypothetical protein
MGPFLTRDEFGLTAIPLTAAGDGLPTRALDDHNHPRLLQLSGLPVRPVRGQPVFCGPLHLRPLLQRVRRQQEAVLLRLLLRGRQPDGGLHPGRRAARAQQHLPDRQLERHVWVRDPPRIVAPCMPTRGCLKCAGTRARIRGLHKVGELGREVCWVTSRIWCCACLKDILPQIVGGFQVLRGQSIVPGN